jgi:CTP synthase (UTP-ammonia lyase)
MNRARIALIGDYDASVKAHQAIPRALALGAGDDIDCEWEWLHTTTLARDPKDQLADFDGVWCVPASPYANTRGALSAIRFARESGRAFLGTCGGFQHAVMEYAEAVWGVAAAHAETDVDASTRSSRR